MTNPGAVHKALENTGTFRPLVNSPNWSAYVERVKAEMDTLQAQVMEQDMSDSERSAAIHKWRGMKRAIAIPAEVLTGAQSVLDQNQDAIEGDDDTQ